MADLSTKKQASIIYSKGLISARSTFYTRLRNSRRNVHFRAMPRRGEGEGIIELGSATLLVNDLESKKQVERNSERMNGLRKKNDWFFR